MTREEAIKILDVNNTSAKELERIKNYKGFNGREAIFMALKDACLMAVAALREQEERRWIPVTERLPDLELVDAKNDGFDLCSCLVTVKNFRVKNGRYVKKAWYDGDGFMDENCIIITQDVTHWMPLPKPPKGE